MGLVRKALGPRSKYERDIPYTYEARVDVLHGQGSEPLLEYYFSDTLCGLVELLADLDIEPPRASILSVFGGEALELDNGVFTRDGHWVQRPELCRLLEAHYGATGDRRYAGHAEHHACRYEDRNRAGHGPF